jgi:hypothetical protein
MGGPTGPRAYAHTGAPGRCLPRRTAGFRHIRTSLGQVGDGIGRPTIWVLTRSPEQTRQDDLRQKASCPGACERRRGYVTVNEPDGIMNLTTASAACFAREGKPARSAKRRTPRYLPVRTKRRRQMSTVLCFPWPRTTIVVLGIILVFIIIMVALGVSPLPAIGAAIVAAVVAATGEPPGTVPGL